ncbi:hypothetical protein [Rheinheimera sp. A13L]|uniref:hypothetical protein n=1 Tax=Rheinheimera sp. A13L TaxID=506534 RepID=UPI0002E117C8|nr:hypothetical protein [Rheinheimera sp. A13L]
MMTRLLFSALVAVAGCNSCSASDQKVAALQNIRLPVTLCLGLDPATEAGVSKGNIRLQIQIRNQQASNRYSSAFQLFLVREGGDRLLLHSFGLQPDRQEQGSVLPQQVQLTLQGQQLIPDSQGQVCFELTQGSVSESAEHLVPKDVAIRWNPIQISSGS